MNNVPSKQTDINTMKIKADTIGPGIVVINAHRMPEVAAAIIMTPLIMPGSLWKYTTMDMKCDHSKFLKNPMIFMKLLLGSEI